LSNQHAYGYSIFLRDPENLLLGYWEYHGDDFEADMAAMAADPDTQRWWALTAPCQVRLSSAKDGEQWSRCSIWMRLPDLPGGIATGDAAFPDQTAVWLGIETVARGLGPTPGRTSSIASMPVAVTAPVARNIEA
jgi:hypothetical protein